MNGNASRGTIEALINVIYTGNNVDSIFLAFFLNQFLTLGYIMGKTISIKVLFGIYLLLMAGKVLPSVVMSMAGQVLEQVQPLFMLISTL